MQYSQSPTDSKMNPDAAALALESLADVVETMGAYNAKVYNYKDDGTTVEEEEEGEEEGEEQEEEEEEGRRRNGRTVDEL